MTDRYKGLLLTQEELDKVVMDAPRDGLDFLAVQQETALAQLEKVREWLLQTRPNPRHYGPDLMHFWGDVAEMFDLFPEKESCKEESNG